MKSNRNLKKVLILHFKSAMCIGEIKRKMGTHVFGSMHFRLRGEKQISLDSLLLR